MTRPLQPPAPPRKDTVRLMTMFVALGLVLVLMQKVRDPKRWTWLAQAPDVDATITPAEIDPNRPATPVAPTAKVGARAADYNPLKLLQTEECAEVNTELLKTVIDKSPRRAEEAEAIHHLLCVAATQPPSRLAGTSDRHVLFTNLLHQPEVYRGKPVHVEGVLARLVAWKASADGNPYGLNDYFEAWIFPEDSPKNPMVVLLTQLPPGLAPAMKLTESVAVDAYFVKLQAFQAGDEKWRAAPLLVGHALTWIKYESAWRAGDILPYALAALAVLAGVLMAFRWLDRRDERLAAELRRGLENREAPVEFRDPA